MPKLGWLARVRPIDSAVPRVTTRQFRENLSEVLEAASRGRNVVITTSGVDRAMAVSLDEGWALEVLAAVNLHGLIQECDEPEAFLNLLKDRLERYMQKKTE